MFGRFDKDAAAPSTIDATHDAIHNGRSWHISRYEVLGAAGLGGIILDLTAATREAHVTYEGEFGGDYLVDLFEDTTRPQEAGLTAFNRHRKKATSPIAPANETLPYLARFDSGADGTQLDRKFIAGGALLITQGGRSESRQEWVLCPGKKYLIKVTNQAGNDQAFSLSVDWYEVE